jgi:aminopeptidase N
MAKSNSYLFFFLLFFGISAKAQVTFPDIDVQHYTFALTLNDANNDIKGKATISIKFLNNVSKFQLNLIKKNSTNGEGMLVSSVTENGKILKFLQDEDDVTIFSSAKNNSTHTYAISYSGIPADGLIISTSEFGQRTFFGDNWPNRAHNWLPCADYPSDKATVDFIVTAPDHYEVVSNGLKVSETEQPNHTKITHWSEKAPLAPKVMVIGVADFAITQSGTVDGIPVYSYVFPENKTAGFESYAYAPDILKWYIGKIGPYAYEKLANVQSKTIYGGMENASAIFYDEKLIGEKYDEELLAHEIAHQWFGDAATEKSWKNLWLSEGFATYISTCYLESKYGPDTLKKREFDDRKKVINFERRHYAPVVDTTIKTDFVKLLNANSYEKGGWALHMLRHKLGDTLFWKGIRSYFEKYKNLNANTADLEATMEQASGQDLHQFFNQWLYNAGHPDLKIVWKYSAIDKAINITVTQKQSVLFQLPLEYAIDGKIYTVNISNKETRFSIPADVKPVSVEPDPNVELLASFLVFGE